jgi:hypothetical protein
MAGDHWARTRAPVSLLLLALMGGESKQPEVLRDA